MDTVEMVQELRETLPTNFFAITGKRLLPSNRQFAVAILVVLHKLGGKAEGVHGYNEVQKAVCLLSNLTMDQLTTTKKDGACKWKGLFNLAIKNLRDDGYVAYLHPELRKGGWELTESGKELCASGAEKIIETIISKKHRTGYYNKLFSEQELPEVEKAAPDALQILEECRELTFAQFVAKYGIEYSDQMMKLLSELKEEIA